MDPQILFGNHQPNCPSDDSQLTDIHTHRFFKDDHPGKDGVQGPAGSSGEHGPQGKKDSLDIQPYKFEPLGPIIWE